jgi:hypothetical protein
MSELLQASLSPESVRKLADELLLIERNQALTRELQDRKEERSQHKLSFLHNQQMLIAQLRQQQNERNALRAEVNASTEELKQLEALCHFHRRRIAQLERQSEPIVPGIPDIPDEGDRPASDEILVDDLNLSVLTTKLKEAIELNERLTDELRAETIADPKVAEFRGLVSSITPAQDNEEDGMTVELQEGITENSLKAFDRYTRANWSHQTEHRKASHALFRQFENLVSLRRVKLERSRKLRNRIDALTQSVASSRSLLMRLLNDQ